MRKTALQATFVLTTSLLVVASLYLFYAPQTEALTGIRRTVNFQGKLVADDGINVADDTYSIVFTIYDRATSGTALWTETQGAVTVTDGVFQVELGSATPIPASFNFNWDGLYLGVNVEGDGEMEPRIRLTAVPYAFNAERVAGLTVQDSSGNASTSGTLRVANDKTISLLNTLTFQGTDSTVFTFPNATGTVATLDSTGEFTNKSIGSTGLTFSGATTDITSASNEDLVLAAAGTGNINLLADFDSQVLIGAAGAATEFPLLVRSGIGSNAALAIDNLNSGDIFTASASGATMFTIKNDGTASSSAGFTVNGAGSLRSTNMQTLTLGGSTTGNIIIDSGNANIFLPDFTTDANGVLYADTNGKLARVTETETGSQCLLSGAGGSGTPSWGSCGAGTNYWVDGGAFAYLDSTIADDLVLGGTTVADAAFYFDITDGGSPATSTLFIGTDESKNGKITLYSSGVGVADPSIYTDATGALILEGLAGDTTFELGADERMVIDATTNNSTLDSATVGSLTLEIDADPASGGDNNGFYLDYQALDDTNADQSFTAFKIDLTGSSIDNDLVYGLHLNNANDGSGAATDALFVLENNDANTAVGNGILFLAGGANSPDFTTGIDLSAATFTNQIVGTGWSVDGVGNMEVEDLTINGTCTGCGGGPGGSSNWVMSSANGTLNPINNTLDLLIGGTATSSADFAVLNVAGNGPATATVSGNLIVMPKDGAGGRLGIGNINPEASLHFTDGPTPGIGLTPGNKHALFVVGTTEINTDEWGNYTTLVANAGSNTSRLYTAGIFLANTEQTSSADYTGRIVGLQGQANHTGSGTLTLARGVAGFAINQTGGSGDITTANAGHFGVTNSNAGTITNGRGIFITTAINNGGGTFENNYGLYIEDQSSVGSVSTYNLYSEGANSNNYFAGRVGIGTDTTPESTLELENTYTNTTFRAAHINPTFNYTSDGNYGNTGLYAQVDLGGTEDNSAAPYSIFGQVNNNNSGTIAGAVAGEFELINQGGGTITSATGIFSGIYNSDGTIGTGYGLYIDNIQATTSYGLYVDGADDSNYIAGKVNIGVIPNANTGHFYVTRPLSAGATGKALAIFDQNENQDILTASAAGTTKFRLTNGGNIISSDLTLGLDDSSATISTQDTDENLTLDPNGTGTVFFHGATYGITSGGVLTVASCTGCTSGFSGEVDDTTNDSLTFTSDDGSAPDGTFNSIFRDNSGDMNINTISGKTLNVQIAGTDEYTFSSAALAMGANNLTLTSGAITFSSTGALTMAGGAITDSAGNIQVNDALDISGILTSTNATTGLILGATTDITTSTDTALTLTPNGTGDIVLSGDADSNIQVTFGAAPGLDMIALSNSGQGTTTTDVDGLSINFTNGDTDAQTNAGLHIETTSSNTNASSFLYGIDVDDLTSGGENASEVGIRVGTGWDQGLVIESGGSTNSGIVYSGAGRPTKRITLLPEYPGATLTASGSASIIGSITSDASPSAALSNFTNYYEWTSDQTTLHEYTIAVRVKLPEDFSAWTTSNAIQVSYNTELVPNDNSNLDVFVYNADTSLTAQEASTPVAYFQNQSSATQKTWTQVSIPGADLDAGVNNDLDAAGDTAVIFLRVASKNNNHVQVGDIVLSYLAKF